jgi:L-rhamnose mutarotase
LPGSRDRQQEGLGVRVCFRLQVKPDRLDEYRRRHEAVWPDMLDALTAAGWRNYSLFLDPGGMLIGYFETDSLDAALAAMAETAVNRRWQASMVEFFEGTDGRAADEAFEVLPEIFNLADQLAARSAPDREGF